MESALIWLLLNVIAVALSAAYSMMEMSCVSFNKIRLHYYVHNGNRKALLLHELLQHPFKLFGTTLIGVNLFMFIGSECARNFHHALGINPDLAPLSQVVLVVVFGELAPMLTARHYAEHVAMLGARFIYFSARALTPFLFLIGILTRALNFLFKGKSLQTDFFLSQEELQKVLESPGESAVLSEEEELNVVARNIFSLRHKTAKDAMVPLETVPKLPSNATTDQMRGLINRTNADFIAIYYKDPHNIVGLAFPRDLIRSPGNKRIRDSAQAPWFVTEATALTRILEQFRKNNQRVAVILDHQGLASGYLSLDGLLEELFGEFQGKLPQRYELFIERTLPGNMTIKEFHKEFGILLDEEEQLSLAELISKKLEKELEQGDSIYLKSLELRVKNLPLLGEAAIMIRSR